MPELRREDHVLDGRNLDGGELGGHGSRTWGAIVEAADDGDAAPSVVARSWQADDSENETNGRGRLCADDSTQDARLGVALGKPLACETKPGGTMEREQKADGGGQDLHSRLQLLDRAQRRP